MDLTSYQDKKIAILGFGREGKSTLQFLLRHGISPHHITILDKNQVEVENIRSHTGEHYLAHLEEYDLIFKTAGMPYLPELLAVQDKLLTQVQFFFDHFKGKVIAITASKGKTTMTSLAYQLLLNAGLPVTLAGNIGKPVLDQITNFENAEHYVVIELSSFMLETLKKKNEISILGALFPVHLDWHGNMQNYLAAKARILQGSQKNILLHTSYQEYFKHLSSDKLILTGKGTDYDRDATHLLLKGKPLLARKEIQLLGEHNLRNITAIVALAQQLALPQEVLLKTLKEFTAVRHRLQKVGTFQGIDFYDDAISTSPFSSIAALDALGDQVDTLFLGGVDGRYDFSALVARIQKSQIRNLVLFPDSGKVFAELLGEKHYRMLHTRDMREGVAFAYQYTQPGKIALLSTATPSFSLRKDFEEKGDLFQYRVQQLATTSLENH